jgi:hypothetical protein
MAAKLTTLAKASLIALLREPGGLRDHRDEPSALFVR